MGFFISHVCLPTASARPLEPTPTAILMCCSKGFDLIELKMGRKVSSNIYSLWWFRSHVTSRPSLQSLPTTFFQRRDPSSDGMNIKAVKHLHSAVNRYYNFHRRWTTYFHLQYFTGKLFWGGCDIRMLSLLTRRQTWIGTRFLQQKNSLAVISKYILASFLYTLHSV